MFQSYNKSCVPSCVDKLCLSKDLQYLDLSTTATVKKNVFMEDMLFILKHSFVINLFCNVPMSMINVCIVPN